MDTTLDRQPIDLRGCSWNEPACGVECCCADWQARNAAWWEQGYAPLGWKCSLHGVFRIGEDGQPQSYRAPEPKARKSKGTLKREAWERMQQHRLWDAAQ